MEKNRNILDQSTSKSLKVKREKFNTFLRKQKNHEILQQKRIKIMEKQTIEPEFIKNFTSYVDQFNDQYYKSTNIFEDDL